MRCRSYWRSEITHETLPWSSEEINRSFMKLYPGHQGKEIEACIAKVANFIESIQLPDSSWFVFSFEIKVWFGYGWFRVCVFCFFFFFFFSASCTVYGTCCAFRPMNSNPHCLFTWITLCRKHCALFTHCSYTVHGTHNHFIQEKILKMGPTLLFKHLKIILLQCFQFSVLSKINYIQTDPKDRARTWS